MIYQFHFIDYEVYFNISLYITIFAFLFLLFITTKIYEYKNGMIVAGILIMIRTMIIRIFPPFTKNIYSYYILPTIFKNYMIYDFSDDYIRKISPIHTFLIVNIIGVALMFLYSIYKNIKMYSLIKILPDSTNEYKEELKKNNELIKINHNIVIKKSDRFKTPFIIGYFRPVVVIPKLDYSSDEMYVILLHELLHVKNRHQFIKLALELFNCIFWWNPLAYYFVNKMIYLMELQVDEKVYDYSHNSRGYYLAIGKTIIEGNEGKIPTLGSGLFEKVNTIKSRLDFILKGNYQSQKGKNIAVIILSVLLFVVSFRFTFIPVYYYPLSFYIEDEADIKKFYDGGFIKLDEKNELYFFCDKDGNMLAGAGGPLHPEYKKYKIVKCDLS